MLKKAYLLIPGAAGLIWLLLAGGAPAFNPTTIDLMMSEDWHMNLLGWLFFRNEPWSLHLGQLSGYLHPVGTTIGYTDSIPLLAFIFKPFSAWLPRDFQYIGLYLVFCFLAQGVVGALIARELTPSRLQQVGGGILFAVAPPLLKRINHPSLCSHWMILIMILLHIRPCTGGRVATKRMLLSVLLIFISLGTHPYLWVMVISLALALFVRYSAIDKHAKWYCCCGWSTITIAMSLIILQLQGYFQEGVQRGARGFGSFSADLLTMFNPMGWSRVLSNIPRQYNQYEGFAYLGLGMILGVAFAFLLVIVHRGTIKRVRWRRVLPLGIAVGLLALISLSQEITIAGKTIVDLSEVYGPIRALLEPFRATGRFIWPLYYFAVTMSIYLIFRFGSTNRRLVSLLIMLLVVLQLVDIKYERNHYRWERTSFFRLNSPAWESARHRYKHLVLYPAEVDLTPCKGPSGYRDEEVMSLGFHAYTLNLTFNSGAITRRIANELEYCEPLKKSIERGELDAETLYITWPQFIQLFTRAGASCGVIEGQQVCVKPPRPDPFSRSLRR